MCIRDSYWAEHIVSEGVTSFLATTITQSVEVLTNAVTNVANVMESGYDGAEILGIHFEGPYLDMKYKEMCIRDSTVAMTPPMTAFGG